jgi:hypothetical protein
MKRNRYNIYLNVLLTRCTKRKCGTATRQQVGYGRRAMHTYKSTDQNNGWIATPKEW